MNALANTKVAFKWLYTTQNIEIDTVELTLEGSRYVNSKLNRGNNPWPAGDYEVQIFLNNSKEPTVKVPFKVN